MRRRWRWPILRTLAGADGDNWLIAWIAWLLFGLLVLFLPAGLVDTDANDHMYLGTYLLVALIVWLTPLVAGVLVVVALAVRSAIAKYGSDLLPRRVEESAEDLRERYRDGP